MKRFLLISDIHACNIDPESDAAPSYVSCFDGGKRKRRIDPLTDLDRLIDSEEILPDCLLCPGDITNQANSTSFAYAWDRLDELAKRIGIPLVATVGNHDVDSRYKTNSYDPREFIQTLSPAMPTDVRERFLEFWAEHFTLVSLSDCNILAVNSAAYHGAGKRAGAEKEHGRISPATLKGIKDALRRAPRAPVNILLAHHHLLKPAEADDELVGFTRGGDKLVQLLNESDLPWIVVHGHKHVPDLFYGHGGSNSPVILSCASFSAQVNVDSTNKNPNQVHLLICDHSNPEISGWPSTGKLLSWTWQPGLGWKKAQGLHGFRHVVGFGYRASVHALAKQLDEYLMSRSVNQTSWHDAAAALPSLQQLIPLDFEAFEKALEGKGLAILFERDGSFAQVGRRP